MKRICPCLSSLCGALLVLASGAIAQDATSPQPATIDFTFDPDPAPARVTDVDNTVAKVEIDPAVVVDVQPGQRPIVELYDNEIRFLQFPADARQVRDYDSATVDVLSCDSRHFQITGKRHGATRLQFQVDPDLTVTVDVIVTRNVLDLSLLLKRLYPDASIEVIPVRDSVILRGTVTDAEHVTQIREIAAQFAPTVHNQLKIVGSPAAGMIPAGYRVLSVPITKSQSVAGILRAGDHVDVFVTFQRRDARGVMQSRTVTLLENVEVFAPDSRPDDGDSVALVSLLLQPEEVNFVQLGKSRGELSLAWRRPDAASVRKLNREVLDELTAVIDVQPVAELRADERSGNDAKLPPAGNLQQIRDELRALHDDVRRLIEILERRNNEKSGASTQGAPAPAVAAPAKGSLVGLYFMADWCGPCRQMAPVVARMSEQHGCAIRTIDIEAEQELAQIFAIRSIPTVVVLNDGREVDRIIGLTTEVRLRQAFSVGAVSPQLHATSAIRDLPWDMLGLKLSPASPDRIGEPSQYRGGLEVIDVRPDSPAARQSIRTGDVLVGLHVWETTSLENVEFVLRHAEFATFVPLKFYLVRDHETRYGTFDLNAVPATSRTDQSPTPAVEFIGQPAGIDIRAPNALVPAGLPTY